MSVIKFLDINGVSTFLNNLKNIFIDKKDIDSSLLSTSNNHVKNKVINTALGNKVDKISGKQLSTNDYTTTEKSKLAGIASGAEVNQNAFANVKVGTSTISADTKSDTLEFVAGSNVTITPDATNDKITIAAKNTTYNEATQSTAGLMSAEDKEKLDGIAEGANKYVHPSTHAASMITQDSTHRFVTDVEKQTYADKYTKNEIDNKLSSLETKIDWKESVATYDDIETTYPNPVDGWTVNVKDTDITYRYDGENWVAISANSIPLATSSVDGRMSKTDKAKLDGIASGANKYTHPSYTSKTSGLYKITVDSTGHVSATTAVTKSDITSLGIPAQDTTYSVATTSKNGLMSSTDKSKLNGINVTSTIDESDGSKIPTSQAVIDYIVDNVGIDTNVVVPVTASKFTLNSGSGRYEQTITVSGMNSELGGMWDILRAGDVLSEAESKIAASITDVIRQTNAIKIACIEKPAQNFSLILYGTFKGASDNDTVLSNMGEWFTDVSNLMAEEKITAQKVVTSLPSDAASHPTTVYWVVES